MSAVAPLQIPGRRGFTIIELLVVISIIAVLVSLILPSFHNAKALASNLLCMSNQRGFGLVCNSYAVDYKVLPPGCPSTQANQACNGYEGSQLTFLLKGGYIGDPGPTASVVNSNAPYFNFLSYFVYIDPITMISLEKGMCPEIRRPDPGAYWGYQVHYSWFEFGLVDTNKNSVYFPYQYFAGNTTVDGFGDPWNPNPPNYMNPIYWEDGYMLGYGTQTPDPNNEILTMRNNSASTDGNGNYLLTRRDDNPGALLATCVDPQWYHAGWNYMGMIGHDSVLSVNNGGAATGASWRNVLRLDGSDVTVKH